LTAIKAEDDFVCPEPNGMYTNPKDPNKYYVCVSGRPTLHACFPEYLIFNEELKMCEK